MKLTDFIKGHKDKVLHFGASLVIVLILGEIPAATAGITKEFADWMYKRNCNVGCGWDWWDIAADAAGIAVGSLIRRLLLNY